MDYCMQYCVLFGGKYEEELHNFLQSFLMVQNFFIFLVTKLFLTFSVLGGGGWWGAIVVGGGRS